MGRNAAFGRPPASVRFRKWWDARSKTSRQNFYLALGVGVLFVAIVMAATARDQSAGTRRVIASRTQPTTTLGLPTPSTVNIGGLGESGTAADLFGLSTTTTPAPATTAPPATTRPAPAPTVATTAAPRPATTVTNPEVVFNTVPPETTTTQPVTTTRPTTTTVPPSTTTSTAPLPLNVVPLLPAG